MSFVRTVKRENPFIQLDKDFIGNGELSLKATGLLTYFLSKPDGWQIRLKDVKNRFKDGETSIRSALNELMKVGYVYRDRERVEDGTFGDYLYSVYERPEYNPKREIQVQDEKSDFKEGKTVKTGQNVDVEPFSPKRGFPELDNPELDNHVHSNNDFRDIDFSNKVQEEEEEEGYVIGLASFFSKNITPAGTEVVKTKLSEWMNVLPYEVIKAELENCALHGAKSWNYIQKALAENKRLGITNLIELQNKYDRHEAKSTGKKKEPVKTYRKAAREEIVPSWINTYDSDLEANTGLPEPKKDDSENEALEKRRIELERRMELLKK